MKNDEESRQFAVRLPIALIRKLDRYTERRKKETGISSLKRADVVRALLENGIKDDRAPTESPDVSARVGNKDRGGRSGKPQQSR